MENDEDWGAEQSFELDSSDFASNDGDDEAVRDVVVGAKSSEQAPRKKKAASRPMLDGVRAFLFWRGVCGRDSSSPSAFS